MATIQWAPTSGTNSFDTPANWQGGVVPGGNDIAEFDNDSSYTVGGSATVGEIAVTTQTEVRLLARSPRPARSLMNYWSKAACRRLQTVQP